MNRTSIKALWLSTALLLLLLLGGCGAGASQTVPEAPTPTPVPTPTPCPHDWQDGVCAICGLVCTHDWHEGVCAICQSVCDHSYDGGVCTNCGYACPHPSHDRETLICPDCGAAADHLLENGACARCGLEPTFLRQPKDYPGEILAGVDEHGTLETWHFPLEEGDVVPGPREEKTREDKKAREIVVYTPPGYDPEKPYNVVVIVPGAGHNAHQWLEKVNRVNSLYPRITGANLLDGMIVCGYCEPVIVAVVEYYHLGRPIEIAVPYEQSLRERVLPFLATQYSTYASVSEAGSFVAAPEHFAFIGVSFGAMIGWQMLPGCADLFSYWGLYSGGYQNDAVLTERLNTELDAEHPIHYLYAGDGTLLNSWMPYCNRIEILAETCPWFELGKNIRFFPIDKTEHNYADWNISLFNTMQLFFKTRYVPG